MQAGETLGVSAGLPNGKRQRSANWLRTSAVDSRQRVGHSWRRRLVLAGRRWGQIFNRLNTRGDLAARWPQAATREVVAALAAVPW